MSAFGFDPSIILAAKSATPNPSFNDTVQLLGNLATQRSQQAHNEAQLAELGRKQRQEQMLSDIIRANADTPQNLPTAFMRAGMGPQAMAWQDQNMQAGTQDATLQKLRQEAEASGRKRIAEHFYDTQGPDDYARRRAELISSPDVLLRTWAERVAPEQYDPAYVKRLSESAVPVATRAMIGARQPGQTLASDEYGKTFLVNTQTAVAQPVIKQGGGQLTKPLPKRGDGSAGAGGGAPADELSPAALDAVAEKFNATGELPPLGSGKAGLGLRVKIMNRALEMRPGSDLAGAEAGFKANAASLRKLQTQADAVDAFEATAGKNLDTFLELSKKMANTSSPLFNAPARKFAEAVAGDPAMAAVNAARITALTEISKVLSGATGGGAVSDSARHEVESLIKPEASLAQIQAAANVLKRDMHNRKVAVQDQLSEMRGRISGKAAPSENKGASGKGGAAGLNPGEVLMMDTKGRRRAVADKDVADAEAHKWKRVTPGTDINL